MPRLLPVAGGGPPAEPPAYGGLGENGWSRGRTFLELTEAAGVARSALSAAFAAVALPPALQDFYTTYGRRVRVLAIADLAQTDSVVNVAQAERLFGFSKRIWMRIFLSRDHPDLVALFHATEMPLLLFFGADKCEFARWGPRPRAIMELPPATTSPTRLEQLRSGFYSRNQGIDLATELRRLLEA